MKVFELQRGVDDPPSGVELLMDEGTAKIRRIDLPAGGSIPPCKMSEDVVFVVLSGKVVMVSGEEKALVTAPSAVYIPGGAVDRHMEAVEASRILAILTRVPG
ncbi:MAG TPA: hypothetical protein DD435_03595 [Cyanobacteria bacterium UBA8530]|nr:hypothetical protein [Cyanobacteria bacterium UBA8530]